MSTERYFMNPDVREMMDALTDALGRSDEQSTEEVLADIRDEGIDVDAALARLKKARLSIAKKAQDEALRREI